MTEEDTRPGLARLAPAGMTQGGWHDPRKGWAGTPSDPLTTVRNDNRGQRFIGVGTPGTVGTLFRFNALILARQPFIGEMGSVDRPQGVTQVVQLARGTAVAVKVVSLCVLYEGQHDLADGQTRWIAGAVLVRRRRGPGREPLRDHTAVLLVALGGVEPAKVHVVTVEADDGEVLRLVVAVFGETRGRESHGTVPVSEGNR
jgi:hypothetical protein